VYEIFTTPALTPVSIPDAVPIDATELLLLLHAPPDVEQYCGTDVLTVVVDVPVMLAGAGLTRSGDVL